MVTMPKIVREISWVSCGILPEGYSNPNSLSNQPDVQKYCLISAKNSYTDFHVDFGGSSVW
jgi:lysine-specific demethylase PHF8